MEETASVELAKRGVKRPMNAFLIFCKRHRGVVREKNPNVDNRAVTRILGDLWANLDVDEKSAYTDLAKQYKDAFLKENPTYKWYNPVKHTQPVVASKPDVVVPPSTTATNSAFPLEQISAGKLADESMIGGLSLLLMAGQHTAANTTSSLLTCGAALKLAATPDSVTDVQLSEPRQIIQQSLSYVRQSENNHSLADTAAESPVDLSQSASNFKTVANATTIGITPGHYPSSRGVPSAASTCGALSLCSKNLITSLASDNAMMFPAAYASKLDGSVSSLCSRPHGPASTVPNSDVYQNSITCDIPYSAAAFPVNYDAVVKSDSVSCWSESPYKKLLTGNLQCENDGCVQYPKTKKQKAGDSRTLHSEVDGREYEALTFGEIQERLITKVVQSGSLSGVFCDEQQHIVGTDEHCTTGCPTGKLPIGRLPYCKISPVQNRVSLATEMAVSSECHNLHRAGSSLSIPREKQSFTTSTQETTSISSVAAMSSVASRLLMQAAHLPLISSSDVNMLIERELTKTSDSTSAVSADANSILSYRHLTNSSPAYNTTASKYLTDNDFPAAPVREVDEIGSDNCDRKPSVKSVAESRVHKLQADDSRTRCYGTGELQIHYKPGLTADVKKSDSLTGRGPSLCLPVEKTSYVLALGELPCKSSASLAGLGQNSLPAKEINNNCRRGYTGTVRKAKIGRGVKTDCGAAVRKSKRCNRGRRYRELMSQGVLQHHSSRKRCESLSMLETSGDSSKQQTGCREVAGGSLVSSNAGVSLQERCKRVKSCSDVQTLAVPLSQHSVTVSSTKQTAPPSPEPVGHQSGLPHEIPAKLSAASPGDSTRWLNICELRRETRDLRRRSKQHERKPPNSSVIHLFHI